MTPASPPAAHAAPASAPAVRGEGFGGTAGDASTGKRKVITVSQDDVPVACILSVKDLGAVFRTLEASRVTPPSPKQA